ncbi:hypothetical protein SteCoe_5465 [Stentor coeruleus]|uniref:Uncharacterized protein n=1 Tax=Stentor coeruleus TaxID=5963 RepID=A0A1R2CSE5_9CILI|nr:hypothetical protein SteCoe_5465 [Stentor coeruleus]
MDSEYEVNPEKISPNSGDSTPAEEPSDMSIDVSDCFKSVEKEDRQEQTDFNESPKYSRSKPIFKESKCQATETQIRSSSRLEKIPESNISIIPDKRQGFQNVSSSIDKKSEEYFESIAASPVRLKQSTVAPGEGLKFLEAESLDFHLQTSELQELEAVENSKSKNLKHQEILYLLSSESSGELEEIGAKLIGKSRQEKDQNNPSPSDVKRQGIKPKNKKQQLRSSKRTVENQQDIDDKEGNEAIDIKIESSGRRSPEKIHNTKNPSESPENNARLSFRAEKIANIPKLVIKKSPERSKKYQNSSSSEKEINEEKGLLNKAVTQSQLFAEDFNQNKLSVKNSEKLNSSHKRTSSQEYIDQDKSIEKITLKIRKSERPDKELRKNRRKKGSDSSNSSRNRTYSPKKVNYKSNTLRYSQDSDEDERINKKYSKNKSKIQELHFSRLEKNLDKRANSPLNYTNSVMYSPEPYYTERRPIDFNNSQPYYTSRYNLPYNNTDFLHKEIFLAKQRLTSSEFGLKSAEQKINLLKSELSEAQRKNFLELSQRLSEVNYDKLRLEVVDLKNESLEEENEKLRKEITDLMSGRISGKAMEERKVVERKKIFKVEVKESKEELNEEKEKIERELRKRGITTQRRLILQSELEAINTKLGIIVNSKY